MKQLIKRTAAIGVAAAIALAAVSPTLAAPVMTSTASLKSHVPAHVVDVRWRGRHRGGAIAAGIATGLIVGGLAAAAAGPRYYDYGPYGYGPPPPVYYAPPPVYVEPAPVYDAPPAYYGPRDPNGPVRQCYVSTDSTRGYGYWRPC